MKKRERQFRDALLWIVMRVEAELERKDLGQRANWRAVAMDAAEEAAAVLSETALDAAEEALSERKEG